MSNGAETNEELANAASSTAYKLATHFIKLGELMKEMVENQKTQPSRKRQKKHREPGAPKTPASAYNFYIKDNSGRAKSELKCNRMSAVVKKLSQEWTLLSDGQKRPYKVLAENDKQRYAEEKDAFDLQTVQAADSTSRAAHNAQNTETHEHHALSTITAEDTTMRAVNRDLADNDIRAPFPFPQRPRPHKKLKRTKRFKKAARTLKWDER